MAEAEKREEDFASGCLTLWRCVGCGAMGNAAECVGACDFKRNFVVDAMTHADLLDFFENVKNRRDALRDFAGEVWTATAKPERFEPALLQLRAKARTLLSPAADAAPPQVAPPDARDEIWLCAHCGQVEAFRDCLGVCIRRNGDFVLGSTHDELAARIDVVLGEIRALTTLARQIAWTAPKPDQGEAMRLALRNRTRTQSAT